MNFAVKAFLILLFLSFLTGKSYATHIVGGEFELVHVDGYNYTLNLVIYFDDVNGNPEILNQEISATVAIFGKRNNNLIQNVTMLRTEMTFVPYTNIECTIESLSTRRLFYTANIYLGPETYNEEEGYYITWQRCCRNNTINNIILDQPNTVGQTFYLEFPPVVTEEGGQFINSSPVLFPPLSDYACVGQYYYIDFAGYDADGDEIIYSMVDPFDSPTDQALTPFQFSAPYPTVPWVEGVDTDNQIPGSPSLNISEQGLLTVTPSMSGLFVFAVRAEEFRDGKKIGEVRRDFQMLVIDCPDPGSPPDVFARIKGETQLYKDGDIIVLNPEDEHCVDLFVRDSDAPEALSIRAKAVNFPDNVNNLISLNGGVLLDAADTLKSEICFPACPYVEQGPMFIDVIAYDDACSLPLTDTIRIGVVIIPPSNNSPEITSPVAEKIEQQVNEGETYYLPLSGIDIDNDLLDISLVTEDFTPEEVGISINIIESKEGFISAELIWETDCKIYDFSEKSKFDFSIVVDDLDTCMIANGDTLDVSLTLNLPDNTNPLVSTSLSINTVFAEIGDNINFDVFVNDADEDEVELIMFTEDFHPDLYNISFNPASGVGSASSPFQWNLDCELFDLEVKNTFSFFFVGIDHDRCNLPNTDTTRVEVVIIPPDNNAPLVRLGDQISETFFYRVGEPISLTIEGIDQDNDLITLDLMEREKYEGINIGFDQVSGRGSVTSQFTWTPDCRLVTAFSDGEDDFPPLEAEFVEFNFLVIDHQCTDPKRDTLTINVAVVDFMVDHSDFIPPNVFTPNDDGFNDAFVIPNLPRDNCDNKFEEIRIYSRLGNLVFKEKNRGFSWDGDGASVGTYYYYLKFTNVEYNGTIHILH